MFRLENLKQSASSHAELLTVVKMRECFDKLLQKILEAFTFEQFVDCFPTLCKQRADAATLLHPLYTTMMSRFVSNSRVREASDRRWLRVCSRV